LSTFESLGLAPSLLRALTSKGYETPTPIQTQAIPGVLSGKDLLGIAQTGTGKTAAFALPILQRLAENRVPAPRRGCRALVLSPTRELATQIAENFRAYGKNLNITVTTVFGGAKMSTQVRALAPGVDVLVATPGRLIDHLGSRTANLSECEILVLDEADQMLDLGFFKPIRQIVSFMPKKRQNLFFSATMPTDIAKLAAELLNDPIKVSVAPAATTVERVNQKVIFVETARKRALLAELFDEPAFNRVIVFTRTKHGADRVADHLEKVGIAAAAIHGDKRQGQREKALADFKQGKVRALVATDIAARGIDVDAVSHVVNFDLPVTPEAYVHRIGRTARAGADGSAVSLCCDDERLLLRAIQKTTRQTIPTEDRRRDQHLGAATAAMASVPSTRPEGEREQPRRDQRNGPPRGRKPNRPPSAGNGPKPAPRPASNSGWDPIAGESRPADMAPRRAAAPGKPGGGQQRSFKPRAGQSRNLKG
jgi:ATP-dependent RNA helicase RhlE